MQSPVRAVAHGAVLVAVAALCFATVASGAFDVVSLPSSVPAAVPPPAAGGEAPGPDDDTDAVDDDPGGTTGEGGAGAETDAAAPEEPATTADPVCRDAEIAWGAAAKAQVNISVEHPEALVDGFTTARDTLTGAEPPAAVAQDWHVVTTYLTMIADAVEAVGADDPGELSRAIDRVGRQIDAGALTQSSQRVTEFFHAGCPA